MKFKGNCTILFWRRKLVAAGKAESHHVLPESGWVSVRLRRHEDVASVIELFRLNYERGWLKANVRDSLQAILPAPQPEP